MKAVGPRTLVTPTMHIPKIQEEWHRADIVIRTLDRSGFSYEGRVFLNNPDADQNTQLSRECGYVGSYHILGYGGLCPEEFPTERRRNDLRPLQLPLLQYKRIVATDIIRSMAQNTSAFSITLVPVLPGDITRSTDVDVVKVNQIGIIIR
jgi:hypothetical protein